jgi:hypothetical protein
MQPKAYFLRLNLEQVFHIVDSMVDKRSKIEEDDLAIYDSELGDVLQQFAAQEVEFDINLERMDSEMAQAKESIERLRERIWKANMLPYNRDKILNSIEELAGLLFGEPVK